MDNSELYLGYIDQVDPLRVFWIYRSQDQVMYFSGNSLQHIYQYLSDKNKLSSLAQDTLLYFLSAAVDKASVSLEEFRAIYYARPGVSSASSISFDKRFNNVSSEINKFLNGYFIQTLWSDRDMQSFGFIKGSEPQKKRFVESIQGKEIKVFKLHAGMNLKSFAKGLSEREASILSGALRDIEKFWNEESKSTTSRVQKQPYDKCFINMDNLLAFEESATKVWIMTSDFWREDILEYESLGQLSCTSSLVQGIYAG